MIICLVTFSIIALSLLLVNPQLALLGASEGLRLWYTAIVPTLLPFMVLTSFIIQSETLLVVGKWTSPVISRLFRVSPAGSFAILTGFLCGFPMGAKVTADLLSEGLIDQEEGQYLLSFVNNISPAFLVNFLLTEQLHITHNRWFYLLLFYSVPLLLSVPFRRYHLRKSQPLKVLAHEEKAKNHSWSYCFQMLDKSLRESILSILKIGGYMMLFAILLSYMKVMPFSGSVWHQILLPNLEISSGLEYVCSLGHAYRLPVPVISFTFATTAMGGICALFQTISMLADTPLSIRSYIIEKPITAGVTGLVFLLFVR